MNKNKFERDLTQGNVAKLLIEFALPLMISTMVQNLYSAVDLVVVGRFAGTASLAGVNNATHIVSPVTNAAVGFCVAASVLIGKRLGAGDREGIKKTIGTLISFLMIVGVVLSVAMLVLTDGMLKLIDTPAEAMSESSAYLTISACGFIFIIGYNIFSSIFCGMGDSKHPFIFIVISCIVNIVLDLVAVGVLGMGAAGAALATIVSQAFSVVLCIVYLKRSNFIFDFSLKSFRIDRAILKQLLSSGIPISLQNVITSVSFTIIQAVANQLGVLSSAATGIASKITSFAILPAISMGNALAAMCAQNFGSGKPERAVRSMWTALGIGLGINLVIFTVVSLFSEQLSAVFSDDPAVIQGTVEYLTTFTLDYIAVGIFNAFINFAIGTGHTLLPTVVSLFSSVVIRVPASYIFALTLNMGLKGLGIAAPLSTAVSTVVMLIYFFSGYWKRYVMPSKAG